MRVRTREIGAFEPASYAALLLNQDGDTHASHADLRGCDLESSGTMACLTEVGGRRDPCAVVKASDRSRPQMEIARKDNPSQIHADFLDMHLMQRHVRFTLRET